MVYTPVRVSHSDPASDPLYHSPLHAAVDRLLALVYPDGLARVFTADELAQRGVDVDLLHLLANRLEG